MHAPTAIYGTYAEAMRRSKQALRAVKAGARWTEALAAGGMLDVATTPGALMIKGPSPLVPGDSFHFYVLARATQDAFHERRLPAELEDIVFADMLTTAWGTLAIVSADHAMITPPARYVNPTSRERPVLEAVVRHWAELVAVGPRYIRAAGLTARLQDLPSKVQSVLVQLGIRKERLIDHPLDDLVALAAEVGVTPP